ncbi:MAG: hypothetical protein ACKN96_08835 [Actinomycetota bacterium]
MTNRELFRPTSSYVFAFLGFFLFSALAYVNFLDYGFASGMVASTWCIFASAIFYQLFLIPAVVFYDEGVEIINPLSRHVIGWQDVEEIETRYTMSIVTHDRKGKKGKIQAFAAPAPGRYHSRTIHQSEMRGLNLKESNVIRAGDSPRTNSGAAAAIARSRIDQFHRFNTKPTMSYEFQFNSATIIAHVVLFAIGTVALVFNG